MTGTNLTRRTRQAVPTLLVPASLLALGIVPVVAGLVRLAGLMTGQAPADDARFFENPLPVTLHILAVIPYSLLGALQSAAARLASRCRNGARATRRARGLDWTLDGALLPVAGR